MDKTEMQIVTSTGYEVGVRTIGPNAVGMALDVLKQGDVNAPCAMKVTQVDAKGNSNIVEISGTALGCAVNMVAACETGLVKTKRPLDAGRLEAIKRARLMIRAAEQKEEQVGKQLEELEAAKQAAEAAKQAAEAAQKAAEKQAAEKQAAMTPERKHLEGLTDAQVKELLELKEAMELADAAVSGEEKADDK
jgi:hypothetical protein